MATNGVPEQPADRPQRDRIAGSAFNISGKMLMIVGGGGAALVAEHPGAGTGWLTFPATRRRWVKWTTARF